MHSLKTKYVTHISDIRYLAQYPADSKFPMQVSVKKREKEEEERGGRRKEWGGREKEGRDRTWL